MEITIKKIGQLPKATIILDGLTVIAGENDTGKSTIGQVIFSIIKANNIATANQHCQFMNTMVNLVFDSQISSQGEVSIQDKDIPLCSVDFSQHQDEL